MTTLKRSKPLSEDRGSKKQKVDDSKVGTQGRKKGLGKSDAVDDDSYSVTSKSKADAPNRFWAAVEPYCSDLNLDDAKFLEDSIKSAEDEQEYSKIPALGKHYSEKWAQEDLIEEQLEGMKLSEKRRDIARWRTKFTKGTIIPAGIIFNTVSTQLIKRSEKMMEKYRSLILDESMVNALKDSGRTLMLVI
ncbi:hypothetical protein QZH41_002455 [Actinostola sp. cb2023]|nr:hypothetical protein QZH41_002455 [Actinostola sp. cb2023]